MLPIALSMLLALAMILFGAELFTNAVEWLGRQLHLGQGAVGSVLAALGTALPETAVPVTAILGGQSPNAHDVGIGGILGAPFLLATLGSLVMGVSLIITRRQQTSQKLYVQHRSFQRDMTCFLIAYAASVVAGCVNYRWVHEVVPWMLIAMYGLFLHATVTERSHIPDEGQLHPLYLQWKLAQPSVLAVFIQLAVALGLIVGGAQLLTAGVEKIAAWLIIPSFVVSALLIPLTTELPETLNSVVWIRQGKDALAIGNITGAMVFQSTLVPALGIWLTPWNLNHEALLTGGLTLAAAGFIYGMFRLHGALLPGVLLSASLLYWILPIQALAVRYSMRQLYVYGGLAIALLFLLTLRLGMQYRSA
ncbi:MAG: sodium:calcium antiporter [Alicyclobacillaceae bacterium]|nr:sodium:calcium antiporter [Alicyclobacillaceae bacterium]